MTQTISIAPSAHPSLGQIAEHGYALVPQLLAEADLLAVRSWLESITDADGYAPGSLEPEYERTGSSSPSLRKARRLFWHDPIFWSGLFRRSGVLQAALDLVGRDATLILHAAFMKPAKVGSAVAPHQDQALWGFPYPRAMTIWVAIDPATPENGCLQMFEGSHRLGLLDHGEMKQEGWHASVDVAALGLESRALPMRPGDAVIWDRYMLHASSPNLSDHNRWGMVMVFADGAEPGFDAYDRMPMKWLLSSPSQVEDSAPVSRREAIDA